MLQVRRFSCTGDRHSLEAARTLDQFRTRLLRIAETAAPHPVDLGHHLLRSALVAESLDHAHKRSRPINAAAHQVLDHVANPLPIFLRVSTPHFSHFR